MDHKNVNAGNFDPSLQATGLENEDDPTANTYSIIGRLTSDTTLRATYLDDDGKYTFKSVYRYENETSCYPHTPLVGYGPIAIVDVWNSYYRENDGFPIGSTEMPMPDGITYRNWLAIHPLADAESYVEWDIDGNYDTFTATIGQAGTQTSCSGCQLAFIIYIDGVEIYSSGAMYNTDYQYVDVDIRGGYILRIETDEVDTQNSDWAVVANPSLNKCKSMYILLYSQQLILISCTYDL